MDFRPKYRELSAEEKATLDAIKTNASELGNILDAVPQGREISLAKTKLEECVMWAVKGLTA